MFNFFRSTSYKLKRRIKAIYRLYRIRAKSDKKTAIFLKDFSKSMKDRVNLFNNKYKKKRILDKKYIEDFMPKLAKLEQEIKKTKDNVELNALLRAKEILFFEEKEKLEKIIGKDGLLLLAENRPEPSLRRLIWEMKQACDDFKQYRKKIKNLILNLDASFLPINIAKRFIKSIDLAASMNEKVTYLLELLDKNFKNQSKLLTEENYYGYFESLNKEKSYFLNLEKISENYENAFRDLMDYSVIKMNRGLLRLGVLSALTIAHFPFVFSLGLSPGMLLTPLMADAGFYAGSKFVSKDAKLTIQNMGESIPPNKDIETYTKKFNDVIIKADSFLSKVLRQNF